METKPSRHFYLDHLRNIFNFQGRMRRRDYIGALVIDWLMIGLLSIPVGWAVNNPDVVFLKGIAMVCLLGIVFIFFVMRWASMIRRIHDAGYSGWWIFCPGFVNFVLLLFFDSEPGENAYGRNPKGVERKLKKGVVYPFDDLFNFEGRMRRSHYFGFAFVHFLMMFWICYLWFMVFGLGSLAIDVTVGSILTIIGLGVIMVLHFVVRTAAQIRRTHDAGFRGWWILCPFFSFIVLFFNSEPRENAYGSNPKELAP